MKTAVIGFPRIGKDRELKFASEKFFRGEITEAELQSVAKEIRSENLRLQKEAEITFVSSNDFSSFSSVGLINLVPKRAERVSWDFGS